MGGRREPPAESFRMEVLVPWNELRLLQMPADAVYDEMTLPRDNTMAAVML